MENEELKLYRIIKFLCEQKKINPNISSFDPEEISEKVFEGNLDINEVEYLIRKLIKEGDVFGGSTKEGPFIGYSSATNDAIYASKYFPLVDEELFIRQEAKDFFNWKCYKSKIVMLLMIFMSLKIDFKISIHLTVKQYFLMK